MPSLEVANVVQRPNADLGELKYSAKVFRAILEALGTDALARQVFKVKKRGVRERRNPAGGTKCWHPWSEMLARGSPNPDDLPLLPLPFTAKELAAFMVHGCGRFVEMEFGDWNNDPDNWLKSCSERLAPKAREAMTDAYEAYRNAATAEDHLWHDNVRQLAAQHRVAMAELRQFEHDNQQDYESPAYLKLHKCERRLDVQLDNARSLDTGAGREWRKAVVIRLLSAQDTGGGSRVNWRLGLEALLPVIINDKGKSDVMTVIRELKVRGADWNITDKGKHDELIWKDDIGTERTVRKKAVSNAISMIKSRKSNGEVPS